MAVISLAGVGISTAFCESSGVNFFFCVSVACFLSICHPLWFSLNS